jgi:hypothetical protein
MNLSLMLTPQDKHYLNNARLLEIPSQEFDLLTSVFSFPRL